MQETEMDFESRIVTSDFTPEDNDIENSLRPKVLDDYIGQDKVKENLAVYIQAARGRGEALDHVLLYGPPGLGKTTLAGVIANEMGVNLRVTSGPAIEKQGDLAALLTNLQEGDVLFIDEIHRLNRQVEEVLYPAMEDGALDIIIGKGPSARSIRLDLPHFTLIGATTRAGQLSAPLRDRFGVIFRLEMYTNEQLSSIVKRSADILNIPVDEKGAMEIASRSRGYFNFILITYSSSSSSSKFNKPSGSSTVMSFCCWSIPRINSSCAGTSNSSPSLSTIKSVLTVAVSTSTTSPNIPWCTSSIRKPTKNSHDNSPSPASSACFTGK